MNKINYIKVPYKPKKSKDLSKLEYKRAFYKGYITSGNSHDRRKARREINRLKLEFV